jgi:hypothetical protein
MNAKSTRVFVEHEQLLQGLRLFIGDVDHAGNLKAVAASVTMVAIEPQQILPDWGIRLTKEAAQELMDNMYRCGVRPTAEEGNAGSLASTKYHLEDMRRLVFKEVQP